MNKKFHVLFIFDLDIKKLKLSKITKYIVIKKKYIRIKVLNSIKKNLLK